VTNTTLTDIADAAGVTRGAVYWHFASKTELFNEMWQQQPPLRDLIQQNLATRNEQEPLNDLRERFIAGLRYIAANPRQRALMQILYQRCEFASDMLSEAKFANALVLIIPLLAAFCSAVCVTIYCQPKQILT
jgi:TetR/AcrR family transcriptional repressor of acrEF/envCD operon